MLQISVRTVEVHRFNLMRRLNVRSVAHLNAASPQGGQFQSWSDGGAQSHNVQVTAPMTFTATFATPTVPPGPFLEQGGQVVIAAEHPMPASPGATRPGPGVPSSPAP